jgi:hypothetical protein
VCTTDRCTGPGGTCSHSESRDCCGSDIECDDCDPCTVDMCTTSRCAHSALAECDAGVPDAGADVGVVADAGTDAGIDGGIDGGIDAAAGFDAGDLDASDRDASRPFDAGPIRENCRACGCGIAAVGGRGAFLALLLLALVIARRAAQARSRRERRVPRGWSSTTDRSSAAPRPR